MARLIGGSNRKAGVLGVLRLGASSKLLQLDGPFPNNFRSLRRFMANSSGLKIDHLPYHHLLFHGVKWIYRLSSPHRLKAFLRIKDTRSF
jgi:hypothetical protein